MTDFPKYKHRPCPCGCGELADECMSPRGALNAFQISEAPRSEALRPCGCYADDPGCPPEHAEFNERR